MPRSTFLCLLVVLCSPSVFAQSRKLSSPLPVGPLGHGSAGAFELTPDGDSIVYAAREAGDARTELYSRVASGERPSVRLTSAVPEDETLQGLRVSADGKQVFFLTSEYEAGETGASRYRLYAAPLDGHRAAKPLAEAGAAQPAFATSPDSAWLVYQVHGASPELFSVPADGHSDPIRLSEHLAIHGGGPDVSFRIAGGRVVFVETAAGAEELIGIDLTGAHRVRLSDALVAGGTVPEFDASSDGARVVYRADAAVLRTFELFSVPIGGGTPARLNGALVANGDVLDFDLSPDAQQVLYRATQERATVPELYVAPIDASAPALKVSGTLGTRGAAAGARFSLDGTRVVYRVEEPAAGSFQLFSAPADASALPRAISGHVIEGSRARASLGAANTVVYLRDGSGTVELFSAPLDGSAAPRKLSGSLVPGGDVLEFELSADGTRALFEADKEVDQSRDLFAVPVNGGAARKINRLPRPMDLPFFFRVSADGSQAFYLGAENAPVTGELYRRPTDASTPAVTVNGPLDDGGAQGDVHAFLEEPVSRRVLYTADQFVVREDALVSVRTDGARDPVRLDTASVASGRSISILGLHEGRVVFVQPSGAAEALLSVPADGALAPAELGPTVPSPFFPAGVRFTPDGSRVVFTTTLAGGPSELYSTTATGGTPVKLSGTLVQNGGVERDYELTPDGSRAVYFAEAETDGIVELFSVPVNGSSPPTKLSGALVAGGDVLARPMQITPDARTVLYIADALVDERHELFAAPVDGGSPPLRIGGDVAPDGDVQSGFTLTRDGQRLVYRADAFADEHFELFVAPLDRSAAPVRLDVGLQPKGDVLAFTLTPDGARALVRADADGDGVVELYSVALDGGRPLRLDSPAHAASVMNLRVDPTGRRVVYTAELVRTEGFGLFSAPIDASRPAVRLDFTQHADGYIQEFEILPDGQRVAFLSDAYLPQVFELFTVPIDGAQPAVRENEALRNGRLIQHFQLSADGRRAYYVADQDEDDVFELYQVSLEHPSHVRRR